MTNDNKPNLPTSPGADVWRDLKKANDALLEKHTVTLTDGPAAGLTFSIPDGVNSLSVDVEDKTYKYLRSAREELTFQVYLP